MTTPTDQDRAEARTIALTGWQERKIAEALASSREDGRREAMRWRDIESAPKSLAEGSRVIGQYLLGFVPDGAVDPQSEICVIWWEPLMKGGKGCWCSETGEDVKPTHWLPLPPSPGDEA